MCERAHWRKHAKPGVIYIGDRNYSNNYEYLKQLQAAGVELLVRLPINAQWVSESQETLKQADRDASVLRAATVRLGKNGDSPRVRVIEVLGEEETILLATTLPAERSPPELTATLRRHR